MEEITQEENTQTSANPFVQTVLKFFSAELISEGMNARRKQVVGFRQGEEYRDLTPEEILSEWEKYAKEAAMNLISYIRNVKNQEINAEVEDFIKVIAPEELLK